MTDTIQIKDKTFRLSIAEAEIRQAVAAVAEQINTDLQAERPLFIGVLNGAFMFMSDLMKHITIPCEITFVKLASYSGVLSTGEVKEIIGLSEDIEGRTIVIVEDIVDTGITMQRITETLSVRKPKQIKLAALLQKPEALRRDITVDYLALTIPNRFIAGYGLDYDGYGRNLRQIYTIENSK